MNQDYNSLNQNNSSVVNDEIPNNQPMNKNTNYNNQFQQQPQSVETPVQNNYSNKQSPKKNKFGVIICVVIVLIIIVIILSIILLNDGKGEKTNNNINNISSNHHINDEVHEYSINYIEYANKSIKIINSFSNFIDQFNGLGCTMWIPYGMDEVKNIDDIELSYLESLKVPTISNDLYNESKGYNYVEISCSAVNDSEKSKFILYFDKDIRDNQGKLYKNLKIERINIKPITYLEPVVVNFSNDKTLEISIFESAELSYNELINRLGQYNDWNLINTSPKTLYITYYTNDYNILLYPNDSNVDEEKFKSSNIYVYKMDIEFK